MQTFKTEKQLESEEFLKAIMTALVKVHPQDIYIIEDIATQYNNLHGDFDNYIGTYKFNGMNVYHSIAFCRYVADNFLPDEYNSNDMEVDALMKAHK